MPNQNTIINGKNIPLNAQSGTVPSLGISLLDWFQYITFGQVTKTTVGFQVLETVTDINFWGIIQPLAGRALSMKPEGQRQWNWLSVHAQAAPSGMASPSANAGLDLNIDDIIIYTTVQYRVMAKKNYGLYSFVYYELVQDYTGSVPTP